jgi:hypothetical protein
LSRIPQLSTHSGRLERWLGKEACENVSKAMGPWYGRPIKLAGVPGDVRVYRGGDIRGRIMTGAEVSVREVAADLTRRFVNAAAAAKRLDPAQLNAGFASLSDVISAFSDPAKRRKFPFSKTGVAGTTAATHSLWQSAGWPAAGGAGSAAPGGRALDDTTTGGWPFRNAAGGQTMKFLSAYVNCSGANGVLLLYDRLFDVAKTMASTTTEAVSGVPTRYQNTTPGTDDSAEDNFLFPECQTALPATAHNWTTCLYTDNLGNTAHTVPSIVGISSCAAQRLDMPLNRWFAPLASGDAGIKNLTQMQCDASVATGAINFVIGHPICWIPCAATASVMAFTDGVTTAFERIFDDACLAFLEPVRPTSTAFSYSGTMFAACS